jgi:hypothetical protein
LFEKLGKERNNAIKRESNAGVLEDDDEFMDSREGKERFRRDSQEQDKLEERLDAYQEQILSQQALLLEKMMKLERQAQMISEREASIPWTLSQPFATEPNGPPLTGVGGTVHIPETLEPAKLAVRTWTTNSAWNAIQDSGETESATPIECESERQIAKMTTICSARKDNTPSTAIKRSLTASHVEAFVALKGDVSGDFDAKQQNAGIVDTPIFPSTPFVRGVYEDLLSANEDELQGPKKLSSSSSCISSTHSVTDTIRTVVGDSVSTNVKHLPCTQSLSQTIHEAREDSAQTPPSGPQVSPSGICNSSQEQVGGDSEGPVMGPTSEIHIELPFERGTTIHVHVPASASLDEVAKHAAAELGLALERVHIQLHPDLFVHQVTAQQVEKH